MPELISQLDHIVIVAATLAQGLDYCEAMLGIRPPKGGEHQAMGTHNHLLKLGEGIFLEVIAINPAAPPPKRPRWFGMDTMAQAQRLSKGPYLATFVARTDNISEGVAAVPELGVVCDMQRGPLQWQITIPNDGVLVENGSLPSLIQWPEGIDPTRSMPDLGFRLIRVDVHHAQPDCLFAKWAAIGLTSEQKLTILPSDADAQPYLVAHIDTPFGRRMLSG